MSKNNAQVEILNKISKKLDNITKFIPTFESKIDNEINTRRIEKEKRRAEEEKQKIKNVGRWRWVLCLIIIIILILSYLVLWWIFTPIIVVLSPASYVSKQTDVGVFGDSNDTLHIILSCNPELKTIGIYFIKSQVDCAVYMEPKKFNYEPNMLNIKIQATDANKNVLWGCPAQSNVSIAPSKGAWVNCHNPGYVPILLSKPPFTAQYVQISDVSGTNNNGVNVNSKNVVVPFEQPFDILSYAQEAQLDPKIKGIVIAALSLIFTLFFGIYKFLMPRTH